MERRKKEGMIDNRTMMEIIEKLKRLYEYQGYVDISEILSLYGGELLNSHQIGFIRHMVGGDKFEFTSKGEIMYEKYVRENTDRKRIDRYSIPEEETLDLFEELLSGDMKAGYKLINLFLPMARCIAERYKNLGVSDDMLTKLAYAGVIEAVDDYKPTCAVRFSTYAYYRIEGRIRKYIAENILPFGISVRELNAKKVKKEIKELADEDLEGISFVVIDTNNEKEGA